MIPRALAAMKRAGRERRRLAHRLRRIWRRGLLASASTALFGQHRAGRESGLAAASVEDVQANWTASVLNAVERKLHEGKALTRAQHMGLIMHHDRRPMLVPHDAQGKLMSPRAQSVALTAARKRGMSFHVAPWSSDPHQGIHTYIIDAVSTGSFVQTLTNTLMRLVMGTGMRPQLYLKKKPEDLGEAKEELKEYEWITEVMEANDRRVGSGDGSVNRVPMVSQVQNLVRATVIYNRAILIKHAPEPLEVEGKVWMGLPSGVSFVHPKDLGMVKTNEVGDLEGVMWNWGSGLIEARDMVYMWNSLQGEEKAQSKWYGLSILDGCMPVARLLYNIYTTVLPTIMKTAYSGSAIIAYEAPGVSREVRQAECAALARQVRPGSLSVVSTDPMSLSINPINVDPKIDGVLGTADHCEKALCAAFGVPYSVIIDEQASNRATLTGKLIYTKQSMVQNIRKWIDREFTPQWYGEQLRLICEQAGKPELAEKLGVRTVFDDLTMESDEQLADKVSTVNSVVPLNAEGNLHMLGMDDYAKYIDHEAMRERKEAGFVQGMESPGAMAQQFGGGGTGKGGDGGGKMRVRDRQSGDEYDVE